jgi:glutaredoxin
MNNILIELYTKPNCKACFNTKKYLTEHNLHYKEYSIGVDITRDAVLEKFPSAKTVPICIYDGAWVGGAEELMILLNHNGVHNDNPSAESATG